MKPTRPQLRLMVLAVSAALGEGALAQTTPSFNSTQAGNATVNQSGVNTTVTQTSQRAVLLWNSLSLGNGASLAYNQPNSSAIAVNRVAASGGQSQIDGSLTANGNVVILNPNGVFFGATANVNVAGLIASTGDIDPTNNFAAFMAGGNFAIMGATGGSVANQGSITVTGAGLAAFVAPSVTNAGTITATSGRITLASAQAATVSLNGGLYEIAVTQGVAGGAISNTGTLSAAGGAILLSALDAANLVSGAINLEGIQQANRIEVNGGHVTLKSDLDAATVTGSSRTVDVCHCGQIQDGIDIAASGATVNVAAGTYHEQLRITKSITLAGAGAAQTIVAPTSLAADANGMQNIVTIGGSAATRAEVSGFTFEGPLPGITSGIFVRDGAHASIHDNRVADIREAVAMSGDQTGIGIFVGRARFGTSGAADIFNNEITGYQKGGIVVDGPGSSASIVGNTIVGEGPTALIAQNGIQVSRGASATVSGNSVRGNVYTGPQADPDDFAAGILFFNSSPYAGLGGLALAASNVITANQFGIWTNDAAILPTISVAGASGNTRNAVAFFNGGYAGQGAQLEYAAWSAPTTAFASSGAFSGGQTGDIADAGGGALGVKGWSGFASIQPAINAVASGGTVNVSSGTYTQSTTLNVNKSITLAGAGQASTIIDARGVLSAGGAYGMLVNADNVALRDFTFYGPNRTTPDQNSAYGIKVQPLGSDPAARLHNFSISNVTTRGASRAELDLNGVVGATIDHVTANGAPVGNDSGTTAGAGIQLTDSANVTITNTTTQNNAWGGIALFQANKTYNQQVDNITVDASSNSLREANPLYMQDESGSKDFGALHLAGFQYAVRNSDNTVSTDYQYTWLQTSLGGAFDLAVNRPVSDSSYIQGWSGSAANHSFYVGTGRLLAGGTRAMSIMKAVDTAAAGDTVNIAPGNYTETASNRVLPLLQQNGTYDPTLYTLGLLVYKDNLTLRGIDSSGNAITSADNVQAWIRAGAITNFGMANAVTANGVTIEGLGFKPYATSLNKTIEIQADNFVFRNNVVDNRFEGPAGTNVTGGAAALYFGENDPTGHPIDRLTVTGNKFYDGSVSLTNGVGANGTSYSAAGDRVISNNTFIGSSNYAFGGVLLTGFMAEIPWRSMPIGGATIAANRFSGFDDSVLVRGDQQGVDLRQVMAGNTFDRSVLVTDSSGSVRGELYASTNPNTGDVTMRPKYSIQSSLQAGVNRAANGDTVAVGAGAYAENVVVGKSLNFAFSGPTVQSMVFNTNTGISGNATASGAGFTFNAPVTLLGAASLATTGGNIAFNGDIQNVGTTPFALSLSTGSGDVTMVSGGSQANPIGFFTLGANDFTLAGTLWVTGFNVGATGNIALSEHSLHATVVGGQNVLVAAGNVSGATFSASPVIVNAGGDVQLIIAAAPGSSVVAGGTASVQNVGSTPIEVNGQQQQNTRLTSVTNSQIIPPDNALPRQSNAPAAPPAGGGGREIQVAAESAGDALEQGFAVEIDLTPGPKKRK